MERLWIYIVDGLISLAAALLVFFLINGLNKARNARQNPHPQHYQVHRPLVWRRSPLTMGTFFLVLGAALGLPALMHGNLDITILGGVLGVMGLVMLLRGLSSSLWRLDVDGGQLTLHRFLRAPRSYALGDVLHMTRGTDGMVNVYDERGKMFHYFLGSQKNDPNAWQLYAALSAQANAALAQERQKQQPLRSEA